MGVRLGRLTRRAEFLRVAGGRRWATPGLVLQVRPRMPDARDADAEARIGFTVSRKVGKAVERNRAKRRLRAAAGEVLPMHAQPGLDYVIVGRRQTLDRPYAALVGDLREAMKRLRAWRAAEPEAAS